MNTIRGKIIILGDDIDTDQILPGYAMAEPYDQLGKYGMAGLADPGFKDIYEPGAIIVAGRNFGCGSSREQAPVALKQMGVSLIIAESFARIFRRNAINIGLPVWQAPFAAAAETGKYAEVNLEEGSIDFDGSLLKYDPVASNVLKTLEYGGLIPRVRAELGIGGGD
jgi:3-isopropylmalate dehydratase small subunit